MGIHAKEERIPSAPADESICYPEDDDEPIAASDLHRNILFQTWETLGEHFKQDPEAYVSGGLLMYYVEGDPLKSVSPDVLVAFGLGKGLRRNYLVWVEGKVPDFAMDLSSKKTYQNDLGGKMELYASLGIQDYFLCDVEALYLPSPLMGFTLVNGQYVPISENVDGGLHSPALNLDFHVGDVGRWLHSPTPNSHFPAEVMGLGIYDPVVEAWLQTPVRSAFTEAELASARAEIAEAEIARLRAELERLKARSN